MGHVLAGALAAGVIQRNGTWKDRGWLVAVLIGANLPDIDYFFGALVDAPNRYHHLWTHSLGFVLAVALVAALSARVWRFAPPLRAALLWGDVVLSHVAVDLLTMDQSVPYGVQLFWPVSGHFVLSSWTPFGDLWKGSNTAGFLSSLVSRHNGETVLREIMILGPLVLGWIFYRHQPSKRKSHERIQT